MLSKILDRANIPPNVEGLIFQLTQLETDSRTIAAARERGQRQRSDIVERRRKLREGGPDGEAAADALIDDEPVEARLAANEQLNRELDAIQAGLGALQRRDEEILRQRGDVQEQLARIAAGRLQSLLAELQSRASDLFAHLAETYAGAEAIREATRAPAATDLAGQLRHLLARTHLGGLIEPGPITPPQSVLRALSDQSEIIRMSGGRTSDVVPFPLAEPI